MKKGLSLSDMYIYLSHTIYLQCTLLLKRHVNNSISNPLSEDFELYTSKLHHFALGHVKRDIQMYDY